MIDCGTVIESKSDQGQSVVKVNILGLESNWLPVLQEANSFKRKASPVRVGTQVVVLNNRYVIGAIFNNGCPEPSGASDSVEVTEYEDGTRISYDTKKKNLVIDAVGELNAKFKGNANITAPKVVVTADEVEIAGTDGGVVRQCDLCSFTGNPHPMASEKVKAG